MKRQQPRNRKKKNDCRCDACRSGVPQTPAALRAWARLRGGTTKTPRHLGRIARHLERYSAPYDLAHVADAKDQAPVHVLEVPPSADRPVKLLVTAGMSDLPMIPPPGAGIDLSWAELMIGLPPDWPLDPASRGQERYAWPLRFLVELARYPHRVDQWLWYHHTFAYGDDDAPFPGTRFSGVLFHVTAMFPQEFWCLDVGRGRQVHFLSVVPLYPEELSYCRCRGAHALLDLFEECGVPEVVDPGRPSVC